MTVRMDEDHDVILQRLAAQWGISKNEAILRAIEMADSDISRSERLTALTQEARTDWAETLDRLGRE